MSANIAGMVYWIKFGTVIIAALIALISGVRRARAKAAGRDVLFGFVGLIAIFGIAVYEGGSAFGMAIMAIAALAGVALGFFAARARMPLALVTALCITFAMIMVVFAEELAQSAGFYALGFGFGIAAGQGVKYLTLRKAKPEVTTLETEQPAEATA